MTQTEIPSYDTGSRVEFNGQTTAVAYVIYNSKTCTLCATITCRRLQLDTGVTVRECEVHPAPAALAEGNFRTWDLDRLTIAVEYVGGIYDRYQITVCDLGTVTTVGDLRFAVSGISRAVKVCDTLVRKLRTYSPQQVIDALPNLNNLFQTAA